MIKGARSPARIRCVARSTIGREARNRMVWILRGLVGGIVAGIAVGRRGFHIPCFVTCGTITGYRSMCPG